MFFMRTFIFCISMFCLAMGSSNRLAAQERRVSGIVRAESGELLEGVTVAARGDGKQTSTSRDGSFSIQLPLDTRTLTFSAVGFRTEEVPISSGEIQVVLKPMATDLEEIVVVGYGAQERKSITPAPSVDNLLQGRAAGVQVVQNSGAPGGGMTVRIRGNTSIGGGNEPLYIVDGVPIRSESNDQLGMGNETLNPLADINPSDIASIEILKDAAATSIYGARASNGVVLITTKQGQRGVPQVSFSAYLGNQQLPRKLSVLNAQQYREIKAEAFRNEGHPNFYQTYWEDITDSVGNPYYLGDTDWQSVVFQDAAMSNYEMAVRGGSDRLRYALSGGYLSQEGIIIESAYRRVNFRAKTDYAASEKFFFGSSLSYSRNTNDRVSTGAGNSSILGQVFNTPPNYASEFPEDWPNIPDSGPIYGIQNPTGIATQALQNAVSNRLIGNLFGEYEFLPGLKFRSTVGLDFMSLKEDRFLMGIINPNRPANTRLFQELSWINENTLAYALDLQDRHRLDFLIGFSQQEIKSESIAAATSGAPTDKIPTLNAGSVLEDATSFVTSWGIESWFGRFNYAYDGKYLVGGTIRRDGSSRFGSNKRFGIFPSASVGWRVSEEEFLKKVVALSDLKLRASFGVTGNQDISNFIAQGILAPGSNYNGIAGIAPTSSGLPNDDLTWESTNQFDVGVDLALFGHRLSISADYYLKHTNNLLFNIQIPETSGFTNLITNLGAIQNKGVEIQASSVNLKGPLGWTTNFNIGFNRNTVLSLPNGQDILESRNGFTGIIREGESLGTFYGYRFLGVYASDDDVPAGLKQNGFDVKGGFAKFDDLDGNNIIDPEDRQIIGNALPDFIGGFSNAFSYRRFELSALLTFSVGSQIMNRVAQFRDGMSGFFVSPSTKILDRWQKQGDVTNVPIPMRTDPPGNFRTASDYWLESGDFLRLKTATLSYALPEQWLSRAQIKQLRLYVTGQNLLTFTRYSGYDPEAVTSVSASTAIFGVDDFTYPIPRSFIFGCNINF